jgi:hypothetical protein
MSSSKIFIDPLVGNVGIGVANPTAKLHVLGNARIEGNLIVNGSQTIIDTDVQTTERLDITNNGTGPALRVNQTGGNDVIDIQDSGVSVLKIKDGGNVGIGTDNPQAKLHVNGTLSSGQIISNSALAPAGISTSVTSADSKIVLYDFGVNNWCGMGVDSSGSWWLRNGNGTTNLIVAKYTGLVGIGTTNPQEKLHVNGNINTSGAIYSLKGYIASVPQNGGTTTINTTNLVNGLYIFSAVHANTAFSVVALYFKWANAKFTLLQTEQFTVNSVTTSTLVLQNTNMTYAVDAYYSFICVNSFGNIF